MTEVVVFPDAAAVVIGYLADAFTVRSVTAGVGTKIPTPIKNSFVRVFRTGGTSTIRVVDQAQLTVEVYANDTETAHDLAQLVRGLMHAMTGMVLDGVAVYGTTEFSGPQDLPDPVTEKVRYTFTMQVSMRGVAG